VKHGEIWTLAGGPGHASKPRPVLLVRDDTFAARDSMTVCLITAAAADLLVVLGLAR
jgi:mRNA interferase MazF